MKAKLNKGFFVCPGQQLINANEVIRILAHQDKKIYFLMKIDVELDRELSWNFPTEEERDSALNDLMTSDIEDRLGILGDALPKLSEQIFQILEKFQDKFNQEPVPGEPFNFESPPPNMHRLSDDRKIEIFKEGRRRLDLWLKNSTFDKMTASGSTLRFEMSLGMLEGYPFEPYPDWMDPKDFKPFVSPLEYNCADFNKITDELFNQGAEESTK